MKIRRVAAGLAAAALVLVMGPAMASGNSYTVAVGGSSTSGEATFSATTDSSLAYSLEKPDGTFLNLTCASASIPSSPSSIVHKGVSIVDVGEITKMYFNSCTWPGGTATVVTSGVWKLHGVSGATSASTDTVKVHLENITIAFSTAICSYRVTGGLDGSFSESTQKLTIDEKADGAGQEAAVTNVVGCLGGVKNNGKFKLQGTFSTTVAGGSVNLLP